MKTFIILFCLLINNISQSQEALEKERVLNLFKEILTSDRSELKDSSKRADIFEANFVKIIDLIENQGFVNVDSLYEDKKDRKTIRLAFEITLTHILQSQPEKLLDPRIITLIEKEINTGKLNREYLLLPLSVFDHDFPNLMNEEKNMAMEKWGIKETELLNR